ncbi:hypothetical protein MRB53_006057 [Persea americana]|uniref:Uncharacterized protein n=1 Tax=Persea americana TaxID=3435 RepID=A0ACC2MG31_PERAE|nr:hypothetical protein MRB53_006057 [Persea americana]
MTQSEKYKEANVTQTLFSYLCSNLSLASAARTGSLTKQKPPGSAPGDFFCFLEDSDSLFFFAESFLFCNGTQQVSCKEEIADM